MFVLFKERLFGPGFAVTPSLRFPRLKNRMRVSIAGGTQGVHPQEAPLTLNHEKRDKVFLSKRASSSCPSGHTAWLRDGAAQSQKLNKFIVVLENKKAKYTLNTTRAQTLSI